MVIGDIHCGFSFLAPEKFAEKVRKSGQQKCVKYAFVINNFLRILETSQPAFFMYDRG